MIRDEMRCKRSGRALAGERILLNYVTILAATCHDGGTDEAPSLSHCSSTRISSGDMERDWLVVDQQSGSTSLSPSMSLSPSLYLTLWNVQSYVRSVLTVMQQGDQGKIPNWSSLLSPSSFLMSDMRSSSLLSSPSLSSIFTSSIFITFFNEHAQSEIRYYIWRLRITTQDLLWRTIISLFPF
jgi:hypothetical protein